MPELPPPSDEQRQEALAKAAAVRRARAEFKEKLKNGSMSLSEALGLAAVDNVIGGTKVLAAVESLPRIGKVTARKILAELEVAESRRLRGLGSKQREALINAVESS